MRILVLNPPAENTVIEYPGGDGEGFLEAGEYGRFPPLGALYVLSYLEKHTRGHELFFKDCVAEKISHSELAAVAKKIEPDIVGITSFTVSLVDVVLAARTIRRACPGAHLCLGGHHPTAFPKQASKLREFDSIVVGEGEVAFTELVKALGSNLGFTKINGVHTAKSIEDSGGQEYDDPRFLTTVTAPRAYVDDLDSLPEPNRSFISHIDYRSVVGCTGRLATVITSRGCPYRCSFCDVPNKKYRMRSAVKVIDEVENCLRLGYSEIHFYDDLFNITPARIIEVSDEILKRGLRFRWDFRGRTNTITKESLVRAKAAGLRMISFGVETGTDEGLRLLNKGGGITVEKVREVFGWCRSLGIKTIADFMIGLPSERSRREVLDNIDFCIALEPDYALFAILTLYPHTELFRDAVRKGLIEEGRWERYALSPSRDFTVDHWEEFLPLRELVELHRLAYRRFYFRPSYVLRRLLRLESMYEVKATVRGMLTLMLEAGSRSRQSRG